MQFQMHLHPISIATKAGETKGAGETNQGRANLPVGQQQNPKDRGLAALLRVLYLGVDPTVLDDDDMLIYHYYAWDEAIPNDEEQMGVNVGLRRLTIDILLPGPTILEQIRAVVSTDGKVLHFKY